MLHISHDAELNMVWHGLMKMVLGKYVRVWHGSKITRLEGISYGEVSGFGVHGSVANVVWHG